MKKISLIPFSKDLNNNILFDRNSHQNRDDCLTPYFDMKNKLEENNYIISTSDLLTPSEANLILFFSFDVITLLKCCLKYTYLPMVYMAFEPPVIYPMHNASRLKVLSYVFDIIFTFQDNLVDNKKFHKLYFPVPIDQEKQKKIHFNEKKYITTIVGYKTSSRPNELYSERIKAIKFFTEKYDDFQFYGVGWDNIGLNSYAGPVKKKYHVLSQYKYTICFENQSDLPGLISEKIFDCFKAGSIPIFFGASNVDKYFPSLTFINAREFENYESLDNYLRNISEFEYNLRIMEIKNYLHSKEFKLFSGSHLASQIMALDLSRPKSEKILTKLAIIAFCLTDLFVNRVTNRFRKIITVLISKNE